MANRRRLKGGVVNWAAVHFRPVYMFTLLYDFVRIGPAISEVSRATDARTDARTDGRTDISSFMIPLWGLKTQWGIIKVIQCIQRGDLSKQA